MEREARAAAREALAAAAAGEALEAMAVEMVAGAATAMEELARGRPEGPRPQAEATAAGCEKAWEGRAAETATADA